MSRMSSYSQVKHVGDKFQKLCKRFADLYGGSKFYYTLTTPRHYAPPLPLGKKIKETGYRFVHNNYPKVGKPFRTPEKPGFEIKLPDFARHLIYENRNFYGDQPPEDGGETFSQPNFYLVYPPHQDWECSWGAIDIDTYDDEAYLKKLVKQIYDEKLPLIPVFSKSKGLHVYIFSKVKVSVPQMRGALVNLRDVLGLPKKTELFPKQKKREYEKKYSTLEKVGNGIGLPYGSCWASNKAAFDHYQKVQEQIKKQGEAMWAEKRNPGPLYEGYEKVYPEWIKNDQLETGNLEEFLDYAEANKQEAKYFEQFPLLNMKEESSEEGEKSNSNATPLSPALEKILDKIKNKTEHEGDRGGTFDNWVVDFIHGAVQDSRTDIEISEAISSVWQYADKEKDEQGNETYQGRSKNEYIKTRIENNREYSGKVDPTIKRKRFMTDIVWLMDIEKFRSRKTNKDYGEKSVDMKFHEIFPRGTSPSTHFKKDPNKQIAESTIYRPKNYTPNSSVFINEDGLKYFNTYTPGPLTPRKFEHRKEIEPFLKLMEYLIPDEKHRELVLDWLACIVQQPGIKLRFCIVIVSSDWQVGKGSVFRAMQLILGKQNVMKTKIKAMKDKGSMYTEKQFILIDEVADSQEHTKKRDLVNELKTIISDDTVQARRMRVDYKEVENNPNFLIFSNEEDALAVGHKDARYFIIFHKDKRLTQKFYDEYHDWLEGPDKNLKLGKGGGAELIYYFLKHRDISKFNPMSPAPDTAAKEEMAAGDEHPLTKKLKEWLELGVYPFRFGSDVVSSYELSIWIGNNCKGKLASWGSDTKILKKCLKQAGGIYLNPTMHKNRGEKITPVIIRNHKQYESMKAIDIVNKEWKPISPHTTNEEAVHDIITNKLNAPTNETIAATEQYLNSIKEKKRRADMGQDSDTLHAKNHYETK